MIGWVSVVPTPLPEKEAKTTRLEVPFGFSIESDPGLISAFVVEVGPSPGIELPYGVNSKVYYPGDRGVSIKGHVFIQWATVIAWEDPD